eukprot:c8837_g1_i1.p1 GENE.c8837_g1_i1~~c8837_g1_i1.p1  ORF type:complete len:734 (-),score=162.93 c8837_g1_i1:56-2230(-)
MASSAPLKDDSDCWTCMRCDQRPLAYLGYHMSGKGFVRMAKSPRLYLLVAIAALAAILGAGVFDTSFPDAGAEVREILQWEGFIYMGALMLLFAPYPSSVPFARSFFLGHTLPADTSAADAAAAAATGTAATTGTAAAEYEYVSYSDDAGSDSSYESEQAEFEYVYEYDDEEAAAPAGDYVYEYVDDDGKPVAAAGGKIGEESSDTDAETRPGFFVLTLAVVMGVTSGTRIGYGVLYAAAFGLIGAVAQAAYMISLLVVPVVVYFLRTRYGFRSMTEAVFSRFGKIGAWIYIAAVAYQLHKMLWSNAAFPALFFSEFSKQASGENTLSEVSSRNGIYFVAYGLVLLVPLLASFSKGARYWFMQLSVPAFATGIICLALYLAQMRKETEDIPYTNADYTGSGKWTMAAGGDYLILVAGWAVFSAGFFNPVIIDHAFLSTPKRMVPAFLAAFVLSGATIILASGLGMYAHLAMNDGQASMALTSAPTILISRFGNYTHCMFFYVQLVFSMCSVLALYLSAARLIAIDIYGLLATGAPLSLAAASTSASINRGRVGAFLFAAAAGVMIIIGDNWVERVGDVAIDETMMLGLAPIVAVLFFAGSRTKKWPIFVLAMLPALVLGILQRIDGEAYLHNNELKIGSGFAKYMLAVAIVGGSGSIFVAAVAVAVYLFACDRREFFANEGDVLPDAVTVVQPAEGEYYEDSGLYEYIEESQSGDTAYTLDDDE